MLNINRDKFISDYWNYYKNLENDFINLTRFVKVCDTNYETCSDEIIKQFQNASLLSPCSSNMGP